MIDARAAVATVMCAVAPVIALAVAPAAARADEPPDVDEHGDARRIPVIPLPRLTLSLGLGGGELEHGGLTVSGSQVMTEVAVGVAARWQLFGDAMLGRVATAEPHALGASLMRAGGGVRWLARQFQFEADMGYAMYLEAGLGHTALTWDDRGHAAHDDAMLGTGLMMRGQPGAHELSMRFGLRVMMRLDDVPALVCVRGCGPTELDRAVLSTFTVGWGPAGPHAEGGFPIEPPRWSWRRARHTLGFTLRGGGLPLGGALRVASSLGVHGGGLALSAFTRLDGEYELVAYHGGGRSGVGQRAGVVVHHPLWSSDRRVGTLYLAGELGAGGSWLRDEAHGRLLVPDAIAGARFGFDGHTTGPSPARRFGLHAGARLTVSPDGVGALADVAFEWGQ